MMDAEEKRNRMRLLRAIVKEHNVQRWIRSFLQAYPSAEAVGSSGSGSNQAGAARYTLKPRRDESYARRRSGGHSLQAQVRAPRYEMGRDAKLHVIGRAVGED